MLGEGDSPKAFASDTVPAQPVGDHMRLLVLVALCFLIGPASAGEPAPGPYPLDGRQMTLSDLVVDARSLMKQRVSITDGCDIVNTSNMFIFCYRDGVAVYLSSSTANRETLRFALKNCTGAMPTPDCRAFAVIGTVAGLFMNSFPVLDSAVIYFESEQGE